MSSFQDLLHEMIADIGGEVSLDGVEIQEAPPLLATPLRAAELSAAALAVQASLICKIWQMRTGRRQTATLNLQGAALALQSVFYQRQWSHKIMLTEPDYPTVQLYPTKDGRWVMLNGGYPSLRDGLLEMLCCANGKGAVGAAVARWGAADLEDDAARRGLCAVMVRTPEEWRDHPQGRALAGVPVIGIEKIADGPRISFPELSAADPPSGLRPLSGIRVLDLTHVIAGPTCAKTLAEQGASVLHIYSPNRPQLPPFDMDTGHGKLSAFLDLRTPEGKTGLWRLLEDADVFSDSYRPGAMAGLGFDPEELARRRPGIVVVSVDCYGFTGPWAGRPGFEQLAQAATGIATVQGTPQVPALALSFYPNDYITGFLAAVGTLTALIRRANEGGSYHVRVSLCRTAMLLLKHGRGEPAPSPIVPASTLARYMQERDSALGRLHHLGPVLRYSETPSRWDMPPSPLGAHPPRWPDWL